jgi:hypothetical protein
MTKTIGELPMLIQMSDNLPSLLVLLAVACSMATTIITKLSSTKVPIDGLGSKS